MKNLRYQLSFLFAVAVFLACVLACRPGFSPDGRRIVFSTFDEPANSTFVKIYDRKTEKVTTLRTLPWTDSKSVYCAASWSPSGAQIGLVIVTPSISASIEILDAQTGRQIRSVPLTNDMEGAVFTPPVFTKDFLLFGGKTLTRLNLRTGGIDYESKEPTGGDSEIYLFNSEEGVGYYAVAKNTTNDLHSLEFGVVDVQHLTRQRKQMVLTDAEGWPEVTRDGNRIAVWKKAPAAVEIWSSGKLEKSIPLPIGTTTMLGNLVWSKDQKKLFAPVFQSVKEGEGTMALFELPADGGTVQRFELGSLKGKIEEMAPACQLTISPDNKALALGTPFGSFDAVGQQTALYVIDLSATKPAIKSIGFGDAAKK